MKIKIVPQTFTTPSGLGKTWAVILDNQPKYVFNTREEVKAFLRGLNGK